MCELCVSLSYVLVTICLLDTCPSSFCLPLRSSANAAGSQDDLGNDAEPEVGPSLRRDRERERVKDRDRERSRRKDTHDHGEFTHTSVQANAEETHRRVWWELCAAGGRLNGHSRPEIAGYESSSTVMSSELDTTSFFDSEEEDSASRWVLLS